MKIGDTHKDENRIFLQDKRHNKGRSKKILIESFYVEKVTSMVENSMVLHVGRVAIHEEPFDKVTTVKMVGKQ